MGILDSVAGLFGRERAAAVRADFLDPAEDLADDLSAHDLDFTPASLTRLDGFVGEQWPGDRFADAEFEGDDEASRAFTALVVRLGAYLGEVLVRNADAVWVDEDAGTAVRVRGEEADAVVDVFDVAAASLRDDPRFASTFERATAGTEEGPGN